MALDTAIRRMQVLDFGNEDGMPIPDTTIDAGDRAHFLGSIIPAVVVGVTRFHIPGSHPVSHRVKDRWVTPPR